MPESEIASITLNAEVLLAIAYTLTLKEKRLAAVTLHGLIMGTLLFNFIVGLVNATRDKGTDRSHTWLRVGLVGLSVAGLAYTMTHRTIVLSPHFTKTLLALAIPHILTIAVEAVVLRKKHQVIKI